MGIVEDKYQGTKKKRDREKEDNVSKQRKMLKYSRKP
jgi:hypothetical protein